MSNLKGLPSGSREIRRIVMMDRPSVEARVSLSRLREHGRTVFPGIENAQVDHWSEDQIDSSKFKKTVKNINTITVGIKGYPFHKPKSVDKAIGKEKIAPNATQSIILLVMLEKNPEIKTETETKEAKTETKAEHEYAYPDDKEWVCTV